MIYYLQIALGLVLIVSLLYVILVFLLPPFLGAPYVPTSRKAIETMLSLSQGKSGERMIDLGSGDGRIVLSFAKAGVEAHGYEINPILVLASRLSIRARNLQGLAHIHWASFRHADFSQFDIVTIYGLVGLMKSLEARLKADLPQGARVVSNTFSFPNWPEAGRQGKIILYRKMDRD